MDGKTHEQWQEEILQFWFGGDQQVNYHTKWFPDGGGEIQARTDREIFERFYGIFTLALEGELNSSWTVTPHATLALIVTLDQFSRHIFRYQELPSDHELRKKADTAALLLAQSLQESPSLSAEVSLWPMPKMVFALMPYRHNASVDRLEFVLQQLQLRESRDIQSTELMLRFRKQTVRRLQHLQDRARLEATDDILEFEPFVADETNIMQHKLVTATEQFLRKHFNALPYQNSIHIPSTSDCSADTSIDANKAAKTPTIANILLISLSGGVDSMVISKILALLQRHQPALKIVAIVAVHIDYANRPESGREAAYVDEWSRQLGVHCRIRVVNEVTRGITERDAYEKIARNIRYGSYQDCIQDALQGAFLPEEFRRQHAGETVDIRVSGMMFGHHLGDVQENIISNVMRGSSPLYLSGMTETSITNGVHVWRPLLSYLKDDIYAFSHTYGVPYFKDSTPSWSTRGKLRRQLIPLLLEVYGAGCLTNLSNLAHESDQTRDLVHANLYAPFLNSVRRFTCGLSVNIVAFRHQPTCFWREVLKLLMHSMGMSLIRDKAVGNFTERIQRQAAPKKLPHKQGQKGKMDAAGGTKEIDDNPHRLQHGWLELRKGFHTFLTPSGDLVILQDGVLRKNLVVYNVITSKNQSVQRQSANHHPENAASTAVVNPKEMMNMYLTEMLAHIVHFTCDKTQQLAENDRLSLVYEEESVQSLVNKEYSDLSVMDRPLSASPATELHYGPWTITVDLLGVLDATGEKPCLYHATQSLKRPPLPDIADALPGDFSYDAHWPLVSATASSPVTLGETSFVFLKDVIEYLEAYRQATTSSVQEIFRVAEDDDLPIATTTAAAAAASSAEHVHAHTSLLKRSLRSLSVDFRFMDVRLRDGLPLLIPFDVSPVSLDAGANRFAHLRFSYRYQGRRANQHGDTGCEVH